MVYGTLSLIALIVGRRTPLTASHATVALGLSILGFTAFYVFLACAIDTSGSTLPTLIVGMLPVSVMVCGKSRHLRWSQLLPGLAATLLGIVLTTGRLTSAPLAPVTDVTKGIQLSVAALACWTAFAVLNARWLARHPEMSAMDWAHWLGIGAAASSAFVWLFCGSSAKSLLHSPQLGTFAALALLTGIGSTWLATICWNIASRRLGPSRCGQLIVSETMFALLYGCLWTAHFPTPMQIFGSTLFMMGVLVTLRTQWSTRDAQLRHVTDTSRSARISEARSIE